MSFIFENTMNKQQIYLYVTPFFPSSNSWRGGFCLDAVKALRRDGRYNVVVLKPGSGVDYEYEGIKVYTFRMRKGPSGLFPFLFAGVNKQVFLKKLVEIGIDFDNVAICHSHTLECAPYLDVVKRRNSKIVTLWQSHQMGAPFNLESGRFGVVPIHADILYLYYRKILENVDVTVLLSNLHVRQFGLAYPHGPLRDAVDMRRLLLFGRFIRKIELKNPYVAYNGIDYTVFNSTGRGVHDGFVIGCVANFGISKDQMTLIRAVEIIMKSKSPIPNLKVVFVGTGAMLENCREYVSAHGMSKIVEFRREVNHLSLPDLYRSFDLFALPTWQEGFCCTLIEAAGCGTPVMSCRGVSIEEVIPDEDKDKWLISPCDATGLAEKIVNYYQNRFEFKFNQSLDIDYLIPEMLKHIDGVIAAKRLPVGE